VLSRQAARIACGIGGTRVDHVGHAASPAVAMASGGSAPRGSLPLGIILAEFRFDGVQRIPFACSYLPGRSKLYLTFWLWFSMLLVGTIEAAIHERDALETSWGTTAVLLGLGLAAASCILRNNRLAHPSRAELRFEEAPAD
jgi:hypothetical protein